MKMLETDLSDIHSEEMQEIIGKPPGWLSRWGIGSIIIVLLLLLAIAAFVHYPEVIKTAIKIDDYGSATEVVSNRQGRVVSIFVKNGQHVTAGQPLISLNGQENFLLTASVTGNVSFLSPLHEGQSIAENQNLFYISRQHENYFGQLSIPEIAISKIRRGQKVAIKFTIYPVEEYGVLYGEINNVADIPYKENAFMAEVKLNTPADKRIILKPGITGSAEIITRDISLLARLNKNIQQMLTLN